MKFSTILLHFSIVAAAVLVTSYKPESLRTTKDFFVRTAATISERAIVAVSDPKSNEHRKLVCDTGIPSLSAIPDVSYSVGNLAASYDPTTAMAYWTMTFNYSGMDDGTSGNAIESSESPISFEAVVYIYSTGEGRCDFASPVSVTSGASLTGDSPSTPYPISMQPVDSTTSAGHPAVRMNARLEDLPETMLDVDARCDDGTCPVLNFCIQLQVFMCQILIDFVDVHAGVAFKILKQDCDNCLTVAAVRETLNTRGGFDSYGDTNADPSSNTNDGGSHVADSEEGVALTTSSTSRKATMKSSYALILFTYIGFWFDGSF